MLLESLCLQDLERTDLEVILSDDCSTESYEDVVKPYISKLNIRRTTTEYNYCPANTREAGARIATGQWLCFSDHDDVFMGGSLKKLKDFLTTSTEKYCVYTSFFELKDDYITVIKSVPANESGGWTHGKFYNLDNLWREYNIHYPKDLTSHEDIYITSTVSCIMQNIYKRGQNGLTYLNDLYTYGWINKSDSLSHSKQIGGYDFLELYFTDYIDATGYVYLKAYYDNIIDYNTCKQFIIDSLLIDYFYYQSFYFRNPKRPIYNNKICLQNFIREVKNALQINNNDIWQYAASNNAFAFTTAAERSKIATGGIIPSQTLSEWLNYLDKEDPSLIQQSPYFIL